MLESPHSHPRPQSLYHRALTLSLLLSVTATATAASRYTVRVVDLPTAPVLSAPSTSTFQQVFNPSFVAKQGQASAAGLLVRSQNCSYPSPTTCVKCSGSGANASKITFTPLTSSSAVPPSFAPITAASVVFGPGNGSFDLKGTEDPRIAYDPNTDLWYMFYTSYGTNSVLLSLATTPDPTVSTKWTRHGAVFPDVPGSKSAALLVRESPPHFLLWGDTEIRIAKSDSLTSWPSIGIPLLSPRPGMFDDQLVESGPPPLPLSDGNLIFFFNSANTSLAYHAEWAVLSGTDPSVVLERATAPLLSPSTAWERGVPPYHCNVADVVFLQAAEALGDDRFQVYFGGSDAVVGTATIQITV